MGNGAKFMSHLKMHIIMKMEIGLMVRPGLDGLCGIPVLPSHCKYMHSFINSICFVYALIRYRDGVPKVVFFVVFSLL